MNVDDFKIHENRDGSVDKTKTDLYLHLVNKLDNSIVEVPDVLRLIDQNVEKLDNLFKVSHSVYIMSYVNIKRKTFNELLFIY